MSKPLLNAKQIPLIGLDGKSKSRKRVWEEAHKQPPPPTPRRAPLEKCPYCIRENKTPPNRVRTDAFGEPMGECTQHVQKKAKERLSTMDKLTS